MIAILDAGILMNTSFLPDIDSDMAIPRSVYAEIKSTQAKNIFGMLQAKYQLTVVDPLPKYVQQVKAAATKVGQNRLSDQDVDVLATALMFGQQDSVKIYSDDFGLRNVAHQLQIESTGVTTRGGHQKRTYKYRCRACGKIYSEIVPDCDICGHQEFQRLRG